MVSLVPNEVTEPCPNSTSGTGGGESMLAESGRLEPMLGQVLAYGGQHPDEFGSYGLVWHDGGDASVFVSFTGNLETHRAALEAMVQYPDELIVCQVGVAGEVARMLQAELVAELDGRFLSIGLGGRGVQVTLAADEEALAGELRARYGDAIELSLGSLRYPLEEATSSCLDAPVDLDLDGLSIEIVPPPGSIDAPGLDAADLTITLTNIGEAPIAFDSGASFGTILDIAGNVVSSNEVVMAGGGEPIDLAPGASSELPLVVSTASCDPTLGYVLPPGDYVLIANVVHFDGELTNLTSEPLPITVGP